MVRLGAQIRKERQARGFTLDELAERSGVSKSMLSEVERGTKTPTVLVLDKLATALHTSIARLLDEPVANRTVVLRSTEHRVVADPAGWERRILSPVLPGVEFEFMRTRLGPGVDAGEFSPHGHGSREYVAVEAGVLQLTIEGVVHRLDGGDSIYYPGDQRHGFANEGTVDCVFYLAMELGSRL